MRRPGGEAPKSQWRAWARAGRGDGSSVEVAAQVRSALRAWDGFHGAIVMFFPMPGEVDLLPLLDVPHLRFLATRTPQRGPLTLHEAASALETHRYGFQQPVADSPLVDVAAVDVVLVPGLLFDRGGGRLGHGAGYYDRWLRGLPAGALRVGIAPQEFVVDQLPQDDHDTRMTHLATEKGVAAVAGSGALPASAARFVGRAAQAGIGVDALVFPEGTRTAAEAAAAIGCEVGAIVKSLLFLVDDEPIMVLIAGDHRVDVAALATAVGGTRARRSSLDEVRSFTGYAPGGTPPLGHDRPLRTVIDGTVLRRERVFAAAGTPSTVFPVAPHRLLRATHGSPADVAEVGG